ncbi:hypothetical protein SAMN04488020_10688 [Palleronia marisminoris]|uniref:Uncharacterized protein n=1 Tax=Palleronia marisminoris TaxID=315423 RepID=A0A1Y5SYJ8_9RHOB|nr:hypothetical protein [Palleronia marisminoris]SFH05988.1 hypothetical protein SAMN04488020_10688 [Palleronia marisminoris]SLN51047.1 hypothetical protein PAM7066_02321 [Palleronia marisminoris]
MKARAIAIGLSIAARSCFMLGLYLLAGTALSASDAARFFQLVFLQAILIAFVSAAGFFRVQRLDAEDDVRDYIIAGICLLPLSGIFPLLLLGIFPVYREIWPVLIPIWLGASASALAGPWAAVVQKRTGPFRAFGPTCLSALAVSPGLVLLLNDAAHPALPYLLLGAFQIGNLALLVVFCPGLLRDVMARVEVAGASGAWRFVKEGAGVGAINVTSLLATFGLREVWRNDATPEFAALVFLLLRVTDTILQLGHMTLAGSSVPERMFTSPRAGGALALSSLAAVALLAGIAGTVEAEGVSYGTMIVLLLACEAIRGGWSIAVLYQMAHFQLRSYAIYMLGALVPGVAVYVLVFSFWPEVALIAYLAALIIGAAGLTIRRARLQRVPIIA